MALLLYGCGPKGAAPALDIPAGPVTSGEEGLASELVVSGPLAERIAEDDNADLVLFYGGEEKGSLESCGCPTLPRGGIARLASYVEAARAAGPGTPTLILNGGYWLEDAMGLDGEPRPDVPVLNRWMVAGLQQLGPDALNVGYNDMAGLTSLGESPDLPLVSANVRGPGIEPYRIVDINGLTVGITGLSTPGLTFLPTPGFVVGHPVREVAPVLDELNGKVDIVVLLAYGAPDAARAHAEAGRVDVVIDTNLHRERYAPIRVGEAIWVRSHYGTMRLGELRLDIEEGEIKGVLDRKIDLDPEVPERADEATLVRQARKEIEAAQKAAFGEVLSN